MMASDRNFNRIPAAAGLALVLLAALPAAAQSGAPDAGAPAVAPAAADRGDSAAAAAPAPQVASESALSPQRPASQASAAAAAAENSDRGAPAGLFSAIKVFGAAGLLVSLFLVGFLLLRKCAPRYFVRRPAQKSLRLVESLSMGEKRSIAVIEVAGKVLLVGNTPHQITLLASLDDELFRPAEETAPARAASGSRRGRFVNLLTSQKSGASPESAKAGTLPPDLRGKMRELRAALEG